MAEQRGGAGDRGFRLIGGAAASDLQLRRAVVEEGLSRMTCVTVEFLSKDRAIALKTLVGSPMQLEIDLDGSAKRKFSGIVVSAEYKGIHRGSGRYQVDLRPWLWFLTRRRECRVFQDKSVVDIVQQILGDYGFSSNIDNKLSGTYPPRDFCLQYRETDLDFLCRLMEEEGIYFYFTHEGTTEKMVLADGVSGHKPMPGDAVLDFIDRIGSFDRSKDHVFELTSAEAVTSGKVTLSDYNFEKPGPVLLASRAIPKGDHGQKSHEVYDHPGHFRETGLGERYARVRMEAEAALHAGWHAVGNIRALGAGQTFQMKGHPQTQGESDFLVTKATHFIQADPKEAAESGVVSVLGEGLDFTGNTDHYRILFDVIPKSVQYRAPLITPWPEIAGIQTAIVVGKAGEEIETDKYGRVRVQFHWDRLGKRDEKSSVWVRTAMPWTGKNWGMIAIPRIGQEVVVQFEDGNPDRPVITGMLYNADNMPPYALPANMTQSGVKTNSSKNGDGFNELMMEDKKGSELVRFQSEKDYQQIVNNDATITVGVEKKKTKGDMTLTVFNHLTETVKEGDHTFSIKTGSQKIDIKTDKTETIEGKSDLTVTGNVTETVKTGNVSSTIKTGNYSEVIETGNATREIKMGNETTTLSMGNVKVDVKLGKIEMSAMQEISLKVGANSVVINQMGVTIKGVMVKIEGSAMLEAKAPMTQVKGDALLILKGAITMIN